MGPGVRGVALYLCESLRINLLTKCNRGKSNSIGMSVVTALKVNTPLYHTPVIQLFYYCFAQNFQRTELVQRHHVYFDATIG